MSITSTIKYEGGLRTTATHLRSSSQISTDAPIDNNGNGALFSPTDLTATSLGSCMLTVMGIAANVNNIPFEHIECDVTKIMASSPRRITEIKVSITVHHDWSESQKKRLERIGLTCPVAKSLHPSINQNITFDYRV